MGNVSLKSKNNKKVKFDPGAQRDGRREDWEIGVIGTSAHILAIHPARIQTLDIQVHFGGTLLFCDNSSALCGTHLPVVVSPSGFHFLPLKSIKC